MRPTVSSPPHWWHTNQMHPKMTFVKSKVSLGVLHDQFQPSVRWSSSQTLGAGLDPEVGFVAGWATYDMMDVNTNLLF